LFYLLSFSGGPLKYFARILPAVGCNSFPSITVIFHF
jgi:hypothetical protein